MLNQQPIEKRVYRKDGRLDVHGIFYTIQGEGPFCGTPATFIRLAGCNLQCPWCDTEYTKGRRIMWVCDIVAEVERLQPRRGLVVITGGEPFRQDLYEILAALHEYGYYVQIESNGTLPPSSSHYGYELDVGKREGIYVVCSPKAGRVNAKLWEVACCAKYVLDHKDIIQRDGLPGRALGHTANPHVARPPEGWPRPVYLQPADHKDDNHNRANVQAVVESAMKHGYIVQLQIHKLLELE